MARAQTVIGLRRRGAENVHQLRTELIALHSRDLNDAARLRADRDVQGRIRAKRDEARASIAGEVEAARVAYIEHRPRARRVRAAYNDPARAHYVGMVAREMAPADLALMARMAMESGDEAAQHGAFVAAAARLAAEPEVGAAIETLSRPTGEEERYLADYLLARHEQAAFDSESVQALSAAEKVDANLRGRMLEAWKLDLGDGDAHQYDEADVNRARELLGCPWSPSAFEVLPEPPKDR